MIANSYFIKSIDQNVYNKNKYVFVDGLDGTIKQNDGKWFFDLCFYIAGDFYLPVNALICNFIAPFGVMENIPLNRDRTREIPEFVTWKEKTLCFGSSFFIDIKNNDFFKSNLEKKEIDYCFAFSIDDKVVRDIEIDATQEIFENFITEFNYSKTNANMCFSNYFEIKDDSENIFDVKSFYLNSYGGYQINGLQVHFEYIDPKKEKLFPIKDLIRVSSSENLEIEKCTIKVEYSIEDEPKKEINFSANQKTLFGKEITISINELTYFDAKEKEIKISDEGIDGFYSPIKMSGKMQITFCIKNDFENKTIVLNRNFSFGNQSGYSRNDPILEKILINNLEDYERITF